jgi:hypothetical protein
MGVLVGSPRRMGYPIARRAEVEAMSGKKQEAYLPHLTKKLLENYRTFMEVADRTKQG